MIKFWCSICDCVQVTHGDTTTGKFFAMHGHVAKVKSNGSEKPLWTTGDSLPVVFALCNGCLDTHPPHHMMTELNDSVEIQ